MATQVPHADVGQLEVELEGEDAAERPEIRQRQKSLTIGAVCKALAQEFPDISISKIRYLEDQKLLTPRRTPGGYRLYTQGAGAPPRAGSGPHKRWHAGLAPRREPALADLRPAVRCALFGG